VLRRLRLALLSLECQHGARLPVRLPACCCALGVTIARALAGGLQNGYRAGQHKRKRAAIS
jgi:hypothetical protein